MVLRSLWSEFAPHVKGPTERKAVILGTVRLVTEVRETTTDRFVLCVLVSPLYYKPSVNVNTNNPERKKDSLDARLSPTERKAVILGTVRLVTEVRSCKCQKISRSHAHAHDSRTTHPHEHRASNGATTLSGRSRHRRPTPRPRPCECEHK